MHNNSKTPQTYTKNNFPQTKQVSSVPVQDVIKGLTGICVSLSCGSSSIWQVLRWGLMEAWLPTVCWAPLGQLFLPPSGCCYPTVYQFFSCGTEGVKEIKIEEIKAQTGELVKGGCNNDPEKMFMLSLLSLSNLTPTTNLSSGSCGMCLVLLEAPFSKQLSKQMGYSFSFQYHKTMFDSSLEVILRANSWLKCVI